ncbi:MAG: SLBB domain-containing protein [Bacteroidia bacterium]|nr:SLBB domain-containing protein [Bacteroidia bacterium]
MNQVRPWLFALIAGLVSGGSALAQPGTPPAGLPAVPIPGGQLSTIRQQMQDQGQTPDQISTMLQGVTGRSPELPGAAAPGTGSGFPSPQPVQLEGSAQVLEEEEAEFNRKPREVTEVRLAPVSRSRVFGHGVFADSAFAYSLDVGDVAPEDYLVGPGDVFYITIYGPAELYEQLTVQSDGSVIRQYIGKTYIGGLTYAQARELLTARYRALVSSKSTIEIRLSPLNRFITLNIVGEVSKPGAYRIPAATPAFNALFAAGGITDIGTVRNIQIRRGGRVVQVLDLYEYLVRGKTDPIFLKDNDFIFVPVQGKVAGISGAVRRGVEYELREEENLKTLIEFAGGLNYDAMRSTAQVARLDSTEREVLIDFDLDRILASPGRDYRLFSGDRIFIRTLNKGAFNIVQIYGNVEYPGTYQLQEGEALTDFIERAGGMGIDVHLKRAYVVRRISPDSSQLTYIPIDLRNIYLGPQDTLVEDRIVDGRVEQQMRIRYTAPDNLTLQFFDMVLVFSESDFTETKSVRIDGQVRKPGMYLTSPTMSLKDLLYLSGGLRQDADTASIEMTIVTRPEFLDVNRNRNDVAVPAEGDADAEFLDAAPQPAAASDNRTQDPFAGLASQDQLIRRVAVRRNWQDDPALDTIMVAGFDRVRVYSIYDFIFIQTIEVSGSVKRPGTYQLQQGMTLKDVLYQAGGLAEDADVNEVELYRDIELEERGNFDTRSRQKEIQRLRIGADWRTDPVADTLGVTGFRKVVIRSERDFFQVGSVDIKGYVNSPGTYEVGPNMTLRDLLYQAEGLKIEADFEHIELSRVIEIEDGSGNVIPIPIVISTVSCRQDWQNDLSLDKVKVHTYDQIFVRKNPAFELQESVFITGEILLEGEYNKLKRDERLSSLVSRAGGVTPLAYLEGAFLKRTNIEKPIALRLDRALRRPGGRYDIALLEGDSLYIPPRLDIVTTTGNVLRPGTTVLYERDKRRLKYYVNLSGGFDRRTKKNKITVAYVDGRVRATRHYLWFRDYPAIEQGAVIDVPQKPGRESRPRTFLGGLTIQEVLATLTSLLTFYYLLDNFRRR